MLREIAEIRIPEPPDERPVCVRCDEGIDPEDLDEVDLLNGTSEDYHKECFQQECHDMFNPTPK